MMEKEAFTDKRKVVLALQILSGTQNNEISFANRYLEQCEKEPFFASLLLDICFTQQNSSVELLSLLLLVNVVKRLWPSKRKTAHSSFQNEKQALRPAFIQLYQAKMFKYNPHLNQLFKFLSRQQFPLNYLYFFVKSCLQTIPLLQNIEEIKNRLQTVKQIIKEFSCKKILCRKEEDKPIMLQLLNKCISLSNKLHQSTAIDQIKVDYLIRIDQTILCLLETLPVSSYEPIIEQTLIKFIEYIYFFNTIAPKYPNLNIRIQAYLQVTLHQLYLIQISYPLHFASFLKSYLTLICSFINNLWYTEEELIMDIFLINAQPFRTYVYTQDEIKFSSSIYNKSNTEDIIVRQSRCYRQFKEIFNQQNVNIYLTIVLKDILGKVQIKNFDDNISHSEEFDHRENASELSLFELGIYLCTNIIKCFKQETKMLVFSFLNSIQTENNLYIPLMQLIMKFNKIYQHKQLPNNQILRISHVLYEKKEFVWLARLIYNFVYLIQQEIQTQLIKILAQVISSQLSTPSQIYQCTLTMNFLLQQYNELFPPNLHLCLKNVFRILHKYQASPSRLWSLIQFIQNAFKYLPISSFADDLLQNTILAINQIDFNEEIIVSAFIDLLSTFLACHRINQINKINKSSIALLSTCIQYTMKHINNPKMQNIQTVIQFWWKTLKSYQTLLQQNENVSSYELNCENKQINFQKQLSYWYQYQNIRLKELFIKYWSSLLEIDTYLSINILEQYLMIGLLQLNHTQFTQIYQKIYNIIEQNENSKVIFCLSSLYLSYSILTQSYIPHILQRSFRTLLKLYLQVSQISNSIRSIIYLIINQHILTFSFSLLEPFFKDQELFKAYIWGLEYVSNRLLFKINACVLLKCIEDSGLFTELLSINIDNSLPIDSVLKVLPKYLQSICIREAMSIHTSFYTTFMGVKDQDEKRCQWRQAKVLASGVLRQAIEIDCTDIFRRVFQRLFTQWNWGKDDLQARYSNSLIKKIVTLLNKQNQNQ